MTVKVGDYEILFHWNHLDWLFEDEAMKTAFYQKEYWKGAMPSGVKTDRDGNWYMSVPRWAPGIPATVNKIEIVNGKPMLTASPTRKRCSRTWERACRSSGWRCTRIRLS